MIPYLQVLSSDDPNYGYNAATNCYEDLMAAGIMDPTKVVRLCLENAASVAKTFLTADAVVVDIKEEKPKARRIAMPTHTNSLHPPNMIPPFSQRRRRRTAQPTVHSAGNLVTTSQSRST